MEVRLGLVPVGEGVAVPAGGGGGEGGRGGEGGGKGWGGGEGGGGPAVDVVVGPLRECLVVQGALALHALEALAVVGPVPAQGLTKCLQAD